MDREAPGSGTRRAGLVAVVSVCGIAVAGFLYLRAGYQTFDTEIHVKLATIAAIKAAWVVAWRDERAGDAYTTAQAITLMPAARNVLRGAAGSDEKEQVARWLEAIRFRYNYEDVTLTGTARRFSQLVPQSRMRQFCAVARHKPLLPPERPISESFRRMVRTGNLG